MKTNQATVTITEVRFTPDGQRIERWYADQDGGPGFWVNVVLSNEELALLSEQVLAYGR